MALGKLVAVECTTMFLVNSCLDWQPQLQNKGNNSGNKKILIIILTIIIIITVAVAIIIIIIAIIITPFQYLKRLLNNVLFSQTPDWFCNKTTTTIIIIISNNNNN